MNQENSEEEFKDVLSNFFGDVSKLTKLNSLVDGYSADSSNKGDVMEGINKFLVKYTGNPAMVPDGNPESKLHAVKRIIGSETLDSYSNIPDLTKFSVENLPYTANFELIGGLENLSKEFDGAEFGNGEYRRIKKDLEEVLNGTMPDVKLGKIVKNHYKKNFKKHAEETGDKSLKYDHFSDIISELAVDNKALITEGIHAIVSIEEVKPYFEKNKDKMVGYSVEIVNNVNESYKDFLNPVSEEYGNEYNGYKAFEKFSKDFNKCIEPYIGSKEE